MIRQDSIPAVPSAAAIPFNRPSLVGRELQYVLDTVVNQQTSAGGVFTERCRRLLMQEPGCREAILTTSCTHALEMAALLLDLEPGDEVIFPPFTFVSTVNAFVLRGAKPVFVDIRPDTFNLDEKLIAQAIGPRTRAIVPVHYAGVGCEMDEILPIAQRYGLDVVEDNAHGLFGRYRGRFLGTFGRLATQSFHETKNFSCGEGGALLINCDQDIERACILRDKGTNRRAFHQGLVDKYTWVDVGSSFGLSDILAAMLLAQLESRRVILEKRRALWDRYHRLLGEVAADSEVVLPQVPGHCEQSYHMYAVLLSDQPQRDSLMAWLQARGIGAVFHYTPLNRSEMARRLGAERSCPVAERVSGSLLRLPFFLELSESDQDRVADAVAGWVRREGRGG